MDEQQSDATGAPPQDTTAPEPDARIAALSFEDALRELESVVHRLESGEATLDESIRLYEQGDRLRRRCAERLDEAQARVEAIRLDADGRPAGTRPFAAA